jgi:predicted transcriptional regulator
MRTTVRIDDDLMRDLKQLAQRNKTSLTKLLNRVIRRGLKQSEPRTQQRRRFRQKTFDMGPPRMDLTKALALAAQLEDEEIIKTLGLGQ